MQHGFQVLNEELSRIGGILHSRVGAYIMVYWGEHVRCTSLSQQQGSAQHFFAVPMGMYADASVQTANRLRTTRADRQPEMAFVLDSFHARNVVSSRYGKYLNHTHVSMLFAIRLSTPSMPPRCVAPTRRSHLCALRSPQQAMYLSNSYGRTASFNFFSISKPAGSKAIPRVSVSPIRHSATPYMAGLEESMSTARPPFAIVQIALPPFTVPFHRARRCRRYVRAGPTGGDGGTAVVFHSSISLNHLNTNCRSVLAHTYRYLCWGQNEKTWGAQRYR